VSSGNATSIGSALSKVCIIFGVITRPRLRGARLQRVIQ
jgi:hypothetical protein